MLPLFKKHKLSVVSLCELATLLIFFSVKLTVMISVEPLLVLHTVLTFIIDLKFYVRLHENDGNVQRSEVSP